MSEIPKFEIAKIPRNPLDEFATVRTQYPKSNILVSLALKVIFGHLYLEVPCIPIAVVRLVKLA